MNYQELKWSEILKEALTVEGSLGNTYNRFYNYSLTNQILLLMQGVHEPVATYRNWQELGRQVRKGMKAKAIIRPIFYKSDDEEETELKGFKMVNCLFSLSDTTGEELQPVEIPQFKHKTALKNLDIKRVKFAHLNGNVAGYSIGREFAINPLAKYPTKTMFHELAHIVLGHTENKQEYSHRGVKEFQAESVAYLIMNELQLNDWDKSESRAYIQTWLDDRKPTDKEIRAVLNTADKILKAGKEVQK